MPIVRSFWKSVSSIVCGVWLLSLWLYNPLYFVSFVLYSVALSK